MNGKRERKGNRVATHTHTHTQPSFEAESRWREERVVAQGEAR